MEIIKNNPQYKDAYNLLNSCYDPKKAFFELAKQKGEDPNQIIKLLK